MIAKFILLVLIQYSSGVIYELSDEDYARMPPMFRTDDYEGCLVDPQGLYCTVELAMVSDEPSALLTMMQEYSEHYPSHYNHTLLRRGICITRTCKQYYDESEGDLGSALEACANETFYNEYKLKTRVLPDFDCAKRERNHSIDYLDVVVAVVCVAIVVANVVASIGDYFFEKGTQSGGLKFLYCFSLFRNWNRLVAPAGAGKEPRMRRLIAFHGLKAITVSLVITGHALTKVIFYPENERFIENLFSFRPMHLFMCGTWIMQTYLLISSFLLVYNWLIYSEKHKPTWKMLPQVFMIRWLRLTPSYGLILALTATWFGKLTSGPNWACNTTCSDISRRTISGQFIMGPTGIYASFYCERKARFISHAVGDEMYDCRRVWWKHLLYINNYDDNGVCMLQGWYLAADTQLYTMAAIVFLLCRTARMRKVVLSLLFVIGIAIPTVITYLRKLDGILVVHPELAMRLFRGSDTFNEIYQRGHTNIPGYIVGMVVAYWVYDWQKTGVDVKIRWQKYRWLYWGTVPLGVLCGYSGTIYYSNSPPPSTTINLLYAAFFKPTLAVIMGFGITGGILQFEDVYRPILEHSFWTIPSRLSFSAYLLHIAILRNSSAMQTTTYTASAMAIVTTCLSVVASSFIAAFFYYILVEGPFTDVIREYYSKMAPIEEAKEKDSIKEEYEINESSKTNGVARKRLLNKIGS